MQVSGARTQIRGSDLGGRRLLVIAAASIAGALLAAGLSLILGARVRYLDHLTVFNALAATMLMLGVIGLGCSFVGLWGARFRSAPFATVGCLSLLFLARLLLDG